MLATIILCSPRGLILLGYFGLAASIPNIKRINVRSVFPRFGVCNFNY